MYTVYLHLYKYFWFIFCFIVDMFGFMNEIKWNIIKCIIFLLILIKDLIGSLQNQPRCFFLYDKLYFYTDFRGNLFFIIFFSQSSRWFILNVFSHLAFIFMAFGWDKMLNSSVHSPKKQCTCLVLISVSVMWTVALHEIGAWIGGGRKQDGVISELSTGSALFLLFVLLLLCLYPTVCNVFYVTLCPGCR